MRRYNLLLPEDLYAEVKAVADRHDTTVAGMLKRFIKLGLIAVKVEDDPDAALIIRQGGRDREILLL